MISEGGGGWCPPYNAIISERGWGNNIIKNPAAYKSDQLVKEEDILVSSCFMLGMVQSGVDGTYKMLEFYTDGTTKLISFPSPVTMGILPGCADPQTGVALFGLSNGVLRRAADGTYKKPLSLSLTSMYIYNIPGVAFYIVERGHNQIYKAAYNSDKTYVESITKLSTAHMGAGPFDISDNYFLTVTTSESRVYVKPTPTSTFEESTYSSAKSNGLISSGEPEFMNAVMAPAKTSIMLTNVKGGAIDDYDVVIVPISSGLPQTGRKITFNIDRNQGMYTIMRNAKLHTIVPAYARYGTTWPASYMYYRNGSFKISDYGYPTPMMDIVYSYTTDTYYGVLVQADSTAVAEGTVKGRYLKESSNPLESAWGDSQIKFPEGFFNTHYLGYLTVLK